MFLYNIYVEHFMVTQPLAGRRAVSNVTIFKNVVIRRIKMEMFNLLQNQTRLDSPNEKQRDEKVK